MGISTPGWLDRFRNRGVNPFTRTSRTGLDLVSAPPYDMSDAPRLALVAEAEALLERLRPNALDAYSREVLDDWLDARLRQILARLVADRDERKAVGDALIGLAAQEVARRQPRYKADLARLHQKTEALEVAREQLTGRRGIGPFSPAPDAERGEPLTSTLGLLDVPPAATKPAAVPPQRTTTESTVRSAPDFEPSTIPGPNERNGHVPDDRP